MKAPLCSSARNARSLKLHGVNMGLCFVCVCIQGMLKLTEYLVVMFEICTAKKVHFNSVWLRNDIMDMHM